MSDEEEMLLFSLSSLSHFVLFSSLTCGRLPLAKDPGHHAGCVVSACLFFEGK